MVKLSKWWKIGLIVGLAMILAGIGIIRVMERPVEVGHAQDGGGDEENDSEPLVILNQDSIKQATVFVMQVSDRSGEPVISCVGSGTLVSADGLILTNAHLVQNTRICPTDRIVIGLTLRIEEPPVPTYIAEIVELSQGFDLAVLRIRNYIDGRVIEPGSLQLPFVELGDSSQVALDDTLYVFGYPDITNEPIALQRGTVSGFTSEARVGEGAWLRTTADIPGLMSGGGAYNRQGRLIGIPTVTPTRVAGSVLDCRQVYDTNGDRQIDNTDNCMPIGGTISALRPSNLARGLVQAAALGIEVGPQRIVVEEPLPIDPPQFSNLFIATGVNEAGMPTSAVDSVPTGTSSLYLFFDYRNMVDGMIYELRTTLDGRPSPLYSLPPVTWSGGREGLWYIGNTVIPSWPVGTYEFTLLIEGSQVDSKRITIGGGPSGNPQFSDLVFGIENALGEFRGANYVIPEGNVIRAKFNFRNLRPGVVWSYQWYFNRTALSGAGAEGTLTWEGEESQGVNEALAISSESGFISGIYRLELKIQYETGGEFILAAMSDFVVAGGAGGIDDAEAQIFSNFRFAQAEQGTLPVAQVDEGEDFNANVPAVYVFFDWRQISPGTPWTWRWRVDNDVLIEEHTHWAGDGSGENYFLSLVGSPTMPDANYSFEIEINGIRQTLNVSAGVGLGQLPVEAFASAEGIQMTGQILDADTGEGIPGAMFLVLVDEYSIEDFTWDESQVLGRARADRNGFFQVPVLIPRGTFEEPLLYSVMVRADGYLPVSQDGIIVTDETESPLDLIVELSRD